MKKIITTWVLFSFALTQAAGVSSALDIELRPQQEVPSSLQIHIPHELATVEEVYEAPAKLDPRFIIHIQNAHGNYDAQVKIKKLLEYLNHNYGFDLMFVEGAAEQMDPAQLDLFTDPEKNIELIHYLAENGQATGADLYLMENPEAMAGIGIEEIELYRENYRAFVEVYANGTEVEEFLRIFDSKLDLLSSRFFDSNLRQLAGEWKKFNEGHREFLPYVKRLSGEAKKILGLDLESLFAQVEWPQITRLLVMQAMEEDIDREKAVQEKDSLITFLESKDISQELIAGIQNIDGEELNVLEWGGQASSESLRPRHLLERLVEEAGPEQFRFQDFPAFSLYAGYMIIKSEINAADLFEEIETLFDKMLDELAVTEGEKDLLELLRDLELLRKTLHLELSRKEWARGYYRRDWIRPEAMVKRLKTVAERMLMAGRHQFPSNLTMDDMALSANIANLFESALRFYHFARKREAAFYYKIKNEMNERNRHKAVLITGGFHTDGLMELFREDHISYGIVTPRILDAGSRDNYIATMLGTHPTIFDFANLEGRSALQTWQTFVQSGLTDGGDFALFLLDAIFKKHEWQDTQSLDLFLKRISRSGILSFLEVGLKSAQEAGIRPTAQMSHLVEIRDDTGRILTNAAGRRLFIPIGQKHNGRIGLTGSGIVKGSVVEHADQIFMVVDGKSFYLAPTTTAPNLSEWDIESLRELAGPAYAERADAHEGLQNLLDQSTSIPFKSIDAPQGLPSNIAVALAVARGITSLEGEMALPAVINIYNEAGRTPIQRALGDDSLLVFDGGVIATIVVADLSRSEARTLILEIATLVAINEFMVANVINRVLVAPTEQEEINLWQEIAAELKNMGIESESVAERLNIKSVTQERLPYYIEELSRNGINALYQKMRSKGHDRSRSDIAAQAAIVLPEAVHYDGLDSHLGPKIVHSRSALKELFALAHGAFAASEHHENPEALKQATLAAIQLSEDVVEALNNYLRINNKEFAQYAQVVQNAIDQFRAAIEARISA